MYPWQHFILGLFEHLTWPVLVACCICSFRKDIQRVLSRLTKLPGGAELNPETVEKQKEDKNEFDRLWAQKSEEKKKELDARSVEAKEEVK